jgi:uncharacterized protein YcgI (DUF1989 family)
MKKTLFLILRKGEAKAFQVEEGDTVKVTCMDDGQLADLTFKDYDQGITLDNLRRFHLLEGDLLYNVFEEPVMKVLKIGSNSKTNILFPGCRRSVYLKRDRDKLGCRDLIAHEFGIPPNSLPSTINLFMDYEIESTMNTFRTVKPVVRRNEFNTFHMLQNSLIGVSACPGDFGDEQSAGRISIEVY